MMLLGLGHGLEGPPEIMPVFRRFYPICRMSTHPARGLTAQARQSIMCHRPARTRRSGRPAAFIAAYR